MYCDTGLVLAMKYSIAWLSEYVSIHVPPEALADRLCMAGFEVESLVSIGESLRGITTGKIIDIQPHPQADRLVITQISTGDATHQIVTGATNIAVDNIVPVSLPGAVLANGTCIQAQPLRGIDSYGMLCSEVELGVSDSASGIWILPEDTPIGIDFIAYASLTDTLLDISILPNRGDALSIIGLAREIATITQETVHYPIVEQPVGSGTDVSLLVDIKSNHCTAYQASSLSVWVGPSPIWMQRRLTLCDIKPINNVVDITNYVLLEMGQPMHAFDAQQLKSKEIEVRQANHHESITLLDGQSIQLTQDDMVISTDQSPIALAGVMGGVTSSIQPTTTQIVLESAQFQPTPIRRTAKRYNCRTDSAIRFEKSIDPCAYTRATDRAIGLLIAHASALYKSTVTQATSTYMPRIIAWSSADINAILGTELPQVLMIQYLESLGFSVTESTASVPSWRHADVTGLPDLAEEIVRCYGIDQIENTPLRIVGPMGENPNHAVDTLKNQWANLGFSEAVCMPMIAQSDCDHVGIDPEFRVCVQNPISSEESVMQPHGLPALLRVAAHNWHHQQQHIRLFECTTVFKRTASGYHEASICHGIMLGSVDFFELKRMLTSVCPALNYQVFAEPPTYFHPGQSACLTGPTTGECGIVHPRVAHAYDLPVVAYWSFALPIQTTPPVYQPFSRYPSSTRDIALVIPKTTQYADLVTSIQSLGISDLASVSLFDYFESTEKLGHSVKSLGLSLTYQSHKKTLEDGRINRMHDRIIQHLLDQFPKACIRE
tara:strand:+ start:510 stop:2837 length:2328 start_codon:yes stop_codon:yes gene_type:complete